MNNENQQSPGESLGNCLLEQWKLSAAGIVAGTAYGVKMKPKGGPSPMVSMIAGGFGGTIADFVYGFQIACKPQVQEWRNSK